MKFWKWLKRMFTRSNKVHTEEAKVETSPIPQIDMIGRIKPTVALVVGHNKGKQGADNYLGESEWLFNSRIARKVSARLNELGIRSIIAFRPIGVSYSKQCRAVASLLKRERVTHAVCLHFNSAQRGAKGVEVLVAETSTKEDELFADIFTDMLNEKYGFVERGDDGVRTISSNHNGYGMLNAINRKEIVSALVEPCFADYRTKESKIIFENEDAYVLVLTNAIHKAWAKQ